MNVNAVARRLKGIDLSFVRGSCELAAGSTELLLDRLRFRVARDASGVRRKAADARVRVGAIPPTPIGSSADADGSNGLHAPHLLGELDHFGRLVVAGTACESGFPKVCPRLQRRKPNGEADRGWSSSAQEVTT